MGSSLKGLDLPKGLFEPFRRPQFTFSGETQADLIAMEREGVLSVMRNAPVQVWDVWIVP